MRQKVNVFISYAHEDNHLCKQLEKHLSSLKQEKCIDIWYNRNITAGQDWKQEIDVHLNDAQIILLLVSANFLASEYCYSIEMKRALDRNDAREACVIPVILRPVDWHHAPFGKLQALPPEGIPITLSRNRDQTFRDITRGIRKAAEELTASVRENISTFKEIHGKRAHGAVSDVSFQELISIDGGLLAVLNLQKEACRQRDVPFFTPNLLLALLEMSGSVAQRALDNLRPKLAIDLKRQLRSYIAALSGTGIGVSFSDFRWEERADVQKAQQLALRDGRDKVTERYLLLGVLGIESNTQQGLKDLLGEGDFCRLVEIILDTPEGVVNSSGTPGNPFSM